MFFININGGSLSTPLTKERVRKSEGSRSQGFKDSSGSLGIFFQNLELISKGVKWRKADEWRVRGLAENRSQKPEGRSQKTGVRRQKAEVRRQESEDRRQETGDRRQETEVRRQKAGGLATHPHCQTSENKGFPLTLHTLLIIYFQY